jgi:subtilisin family serine protease/subtilisin-like proprotein convertase family protein
MYNVHYGGKQGHSYSLTVSDNRVVVRTKDHSSSLESRPFETAPLSAEARRLMNALDLEYRFNTAGVEIWRTKTEYAARTTRDVVRNVLKADPAIEFAGRVLVDPVSEAPIVYTENFFVKFKPDIKASACRKLLRDYQLIIKREVPYAQNAYIVSAPAGTGLAIFDLGEKLLAEPSVELCHPELIRQGRRRQVFPQQWHLDTTTINGHLIEAHAHVASAWELSRGEGVVIAVIDDGVDIDHEEFASPGKIVAPRDVTRKNDNPRPGNGNNHGTACAGVACAEGLFGASGVAPQAKLMPIRLVSELGSLDEADAFVWAAQNGADVISCSWGPPDGDWFDPSDPLHQQVVPLPDSTRLAIDYAVTQGRNGKGCVVLFAAGNGNESVSNDGYASYERVITIAACNDRGTRSAYSDYGPAVWCCFPSNHGDPSLTPGIWTTDRTGNLGYNPGIETRGDTLGNYTNTFGGTSSACPGAAGVVALMLARNPSLTPDEVRDLLRRSCDPIDPEGGAYDENGHSDFYGYGRINARLAVELAISSLATTQTLAPTVSTPVVRSIEKKVPILDRRTVSLELPIEERDLLAALCVLVELEHSAIGDLVIELLPPPELEVEPIVLHQREGGVESNLRKRYDASTTPALGALKGKSPAGVWQLRIADRVKGDRGVLRSFALELHF